MSSIYYLDITTLVLYNYAAFMRYLSCCGVHLLCLPVKFQCLLRQAFVDDEASTRLLQILLFLLVFTASLMFIPCAVRSSFTLFMHIFVCFPLPFVPSTCPYSATAGSLFPSILVTCPNHVSLLFLILSTNVTCCPSSFLVASFRIFSLRTRLPERTWDNRSHCITPDSHSLHV